VGGLETTTVQARVQKQRAEPKRPAGAGGSGASTRLRSQGTPPYNTYASSCYSSWRPRCTGLSMSDAGASSERTTFCGCWGQTPTLHGGQVWV